MPQSEGHKIRPRVLRCALRAASVAGTLRAGSVAGTLRAGSGVRGESGLVSFFPVQALVLVFD